MKSWEGHEKIMIKSWESHKKSMRKSWKRHEKLWGSQENHRCVITFLEVNLWQLLLSLSIRGQFIKFYNYRQSLSEIQSDTNTFEIILYECYKKHTSDTSRIFFKVNASLNFWGKISNPCSPNKTRKIPHTGDTNSLNVCK